MVFEHKHFETEIGAVPADWDIVPLNTVCKEHKNAVSPDHYSSLPYVGLEHVTPGNPRLTSWGSADEVKSAKTLFRRGHVLYGKLRPYLDKAALAPFEGICSTDIIVIEALEGRTIPEFLVNTLHTEAFVGFATSTMTGVNHPRTRWASLQQFAIPLPPLPEQRRIAAVLNAIQDAIAAQEDVIAEARALKRSLMQRLFTYGPGREPAETKETEIGEIPAHWKTTPLRELCVNIVDCPHTTPNFKKSGVLTVRNFNIRDGQLQLQDSYYTSEKEYLERIRRLEPQAGDVLFSREAPIGEACLIPHGQRLSLGQRTMLFRPDPGKLNGQFLVYAFYSAGVQNLMQALGKGVTAKHLNVGDVRTMSVPVAPMHEQDAIATMVSALDSKIAVEEDRKVALQDLFRSALHQLMTGQIRLLSDEGEPRQPTI